MPAGAAADAVRPCVDIDKLGGRRRRRTAVRRDRPAARPGRLAGPGLDADRGREGARRPPADRRAARRIRRERADVGSWSRRASTRGTPRSSAGWPRATRRTRSGSTASTWSAPPAAAPRRSWRCSRSGSTNDPDDRDRGDVRAAARDRPAPPGRTRLHEHALDPRPRRRARRTRRRASPSTLYRPEQGRRVTAATTDADGRVRFDLELGAGTHGLLLRHRRRTSRRPSATPSTPRSRSRSRSTPEQSHYHVALLLSPYSYTTYRGS